MTERTQLNRFKETVTRRSNYLVDSKFIAIAGYQFAAGFNRVNSLINLEKRSSSILQDLAKKYRIVNNNASVHASLNTLFNSTFPRDGQIIVIELCPDVDYIRSETTITDLKDFVEYYKLDHLERWAIGK